MEAYSLNLNTTGQQEAGKFRQYLWDLGLVHSRFVSCLRKKNGENTESSPETLTKWTYEKFCILRLQKSQDIQFIKKKIDKWLVYTV